MMFGVELERIRIDAQMLVLIVVLLVSAVGVIYTKHVSRSEFIVLQNLNQQRDKLNEEWGRLLLEESTWASPNRIEQQARARLDMIVPTPDMTVVIKP